MDVQRGDIGWWPDERLPGGPGTQPRSYLRALVAERRDHRGGDDLISLLISGAGQGRVSETELLSMIFLLLLAGHEGTTALIGNGIVSLLAHPGQHAVLCHRPELMDAAVAEIIRELTGRWNSRRGALPPDQ